MGRNVPKLRFPEFTGEWEEKKLGDAISISNKKCRNTTTDAIKIVDLEHLNPVKGGINGYTFSDISTSTKNGFKAGQVLFGKLRPYLRKYWLAEFDGGCTTEIWVLDGVGIDNKFLYQVVQTDNFITLANNTSGTKMPRADWSLMRMANFSHPCKEEQTKIANFLSTLDSRISIQAEKVEKLELIKKGYMQRIFSQELRFKREDGSEYPDWEEKRLGDISSIKTGKLDANAMVENGEYRFYTCAKDYYYIDRYAYDTDALLVSGNGANVGYIHHYKGKFNAYQRTYILDKFAENIVYVKYFMERYLPKRILDEKNDGNTPYIVLSTLTDMPIQLPSIEEQTKIADFLSNLDNKIEVERKMLETLQGMKKGFLQKMFV